METDNSNLMGRTEMVHEGHGDPEGKHRPCPHPVGKDGSGPPTLGRSDLLTF